MYVTWVFHYDFFVEDSATEELFKNTKIIVVVDAGKTINCERNLVYVTGS